MRADQRILQLGHDLNKSGRLPQPAARCLTWLLAFIETPGRFAEFLRYTFVSGSALLLDLIAFFALTKSGLMGPALGGAVSCMVGLALHYILSVHFVFDAKATSKSDRQLLIEYALTGVMGFVLTASAIFLAVHIAGLPVVIGKLFGVGVTFVSVYVVRAGIVFAPAGGFASNGPSAAASPKAPRTAQP